MGTITAFPPAGKALREDLIPAVSSISDEIFLTTSYILNRKDGLMDLTEIYQKRVRNSSRTRNSAACWIMWKQVSSSENDRQVINRFTFRQKSIDAPQAATACTSARSGASPRR